MVRPQTQPQTQLLWSDPRLNAYNSDLRISSVSVNESQINYQYDNDRLLTGAGSLSVLRAPDSGFMTNAVLGDTDASYAFDGFGEIRHFVAYAGASNLLDQTCAYDKLGRITNRIEIIAETTNVFSYEYDVRLCCVSACVYGLLYAGCRN